MVPAGSSVDGSTILAYNADSPDQVGGVSHWLGGKHEPGELRPTYGWDDGKYLGAIPQPAETYNVVGNTNEHQLSITETTFGGLKMLDGSAGNAICDKTHGCLDYGQLIYVTLARSKTADEAIKNIDHLLQTYGYASSGESFSIADTTDVWLMEIIGKGNFSKGAVWAATRIPDGTVCAHANQARTRDFTPNTPSRFRHAADVVSFARALGLYSGPDNLFSFSDVYDPVTPYGARTCEARVYSLFRRVAAPDEHIERYLDYVQGFNMKNRMPLYVRVGRKVSVNDTFWLMRDHYIGTPLDNDDDISGGLWRSPSQVGSEGKVWSYKGDRYINERPISVSFTHWNLVANQRPGHKYGVLWFGYDDSAFTIRAPIYGVASKIARAWDDANCTSRDYCKESFGLPGTIRNFSIDSMFWVTNLVANWAYSRYDAISPAVYQKLAEVESRLLAAVDASDRIIDGLDDQQAAAEAATDFSLRTAEALHREWVEFFGTLFATYVDGYEMLPAQAGATEVSKKGSNLRGLIKAEIAKQTGARYLLPGKPSAGETNLAAVLDKRQLRSMGRTHDPDESSLEGANFDELSGSSLSGLIIGIPLVVLLLSATFTLGMAAGRHSNARKAASGSFSEPLLTA